jgi:hypothetical protein
MRKQRLQYMKAAASFAATLGGSIFARVAASWIMP